MRERTLHSDPMVTQWLPGAPRPQWTRGGPESCANTRLRCVAGETFFNRIHISYGRLTAHMKKFHKSEVVQETFKCPHCSKVFPRKWNMENHVKTRHLKLKEFECPVADCKKPFFSKLDVERHMASVHSDEFQFKCDICGDRFAIKSGLTRHMATIHAESKDWVCSISSCNKQFATKQILEQHLRNVHGVKTKTENEDDRPFECLKCHRRFLTQPDLDTHIQTRHKLKKPFRCPSCKIKKTFITKDKLKTHWLKYHAGKAWVSPQKRPAHEDERKPNEAAQPGSESAHNDKDPASVLDSDRDDAAETDFLDVSISDGRSETERENLMEDLVLQEHVLNTHFH